MIKIFDIRGVFDVNFEYQKMISKATQSFFDDPTVSQIWCESTNPPSESSALFTDQMYVQQGGELVKYKFQLNDHYLLYYPAEVPIQNIVKNKAKWMSLLNVGAQLIRSPAAGCGIKLTKNQETFEFFGDVEVWFNYMKRFCILSNFSGHYQLVKKIGAGNFAQVFKALDKHESTEYAIKCFPKNSIKSIEDRLSIIKEIAIMRRIQHESVVRLYEVYESEDHVYLVLELLRGGELYRFLKVSPPFSEDRCAKVIFKLLRGVAHIHEKGILHRDLKPENLILRQPDNLDEICIADFGLADYYNASGKYLFTRCGTPGYVAPELLQDKLYDYKVDVFSVGILMYLLITGHPPFEGKDYDEVVIKNYRGKIDYDRVKLSEHGLSLLKGLLNLNPIERLSAQEALHHQWFIQEKLSKSCQFKVRKQNQYLQKFSHGQDITPKTKSQNITPQTNSTTASPLLTRTNLDESPKTPKTPVYSPRPLQRVVRKSIFNFK